MLKECQKCNDILMDLYIPAMLGMGCFTQNKALMNPHLPLSNHFALKKEYIQSIALRKTRTP